MWHDQREVDLLATRVEKAIHRSQELCTMPASARSNQVLSLHVVDAQSGVLSTHWSSPYRPRVGVYGLPLGTA